jgi:3-dehydroquinate synthase
MPVHFKKPGLEYALEQALSIANQCIIVSTSNIANFIPTGISVCLLPDGENAKSFDSYQLLLNFLEEKKVERGDLLIAFGGGALLDVAGFAASTYLRGIHYFSVPTTLLAMSDACFGGKTGINFKGLKNRVGTFYPPTEIVIDPTYLNTIPRAALKFSMAEIVKHGVIGSSSLFADLEENLPLFLEGFRSALPRWIQKSLEVKQTIVEMDPFEKLGVREALNFGHTVGHALEELSCGALSHGAAVWHGMRVEITHSYLSGSLPQQEYLRFIQLYDMISGPFPFMSLDFELLKRDKKTRDGVPRIVKLTALGELTCSLSPSYSWTELEFKEAWNETVRSYQTSLSCSH